MCGDEGNEEEVVGVFNTPGKAVQRGSLTDSDMGGRRKFVVLVKDT